MGSLWGVKWGANDDQYGTPAADFDGGEQRTDGGDIRALARSGWPREREADNGNSCIWSEAGACFPTK